MGHTATSESFISALQKYVDWQRFFRLVSAIGTSLDGPKDRFDKSSILESAVAYYCSRPKMLVWVDGAHHDHEFTLDRVSATVEMKFSHSLMSTSATGKLKRQTTARLRNVLSSNDRADRKRRFQSNLADYLLLADHRRIGVLDRRTVIRHADFEASDCIHLVIPTTKVALVAERVGSMPAALCCDYLERKKRMILETVQAIR